ncbi:MAG: T9SS type A sorting domain-containing protein [Flavobacteriales bacterium]|nr:T9SS type A sorting domain-containing protein [Flavobacteriales bacterium]
MNCYYLSVLFPFLAASTLAQFSATITVTDLGTGTPLENATVMLDGNFQSTDATGQTVFVGLADNTYEYTVSAACYMSGLGSVTIAGADADAPLALETLTTNTVFFFVGSPMQIMGATVTLYDGANYNESFVTSNPWGDMLADVPYGEYSYSITLPCYETVSGTITVACNNGDGNAVFAEPAEATTNNVFFFIGSPFALIGATVQITDGADYNHSFVTWDTWGGEMVGDVPFGEYSYTITTPCYETVSGTVTVDCNNGDGIIVAAEPAEATTNNVFFFIGSPFALIGATVQITDGGDYNHSFVTWDTWGGEMVGDVPFGEYSYTITTPCYETVSGTVTVDCNNGDGIIVAAEPAEIVIDATVTFDGSVLAAVSPGLEYQWVDCDNGNALVDGAIGQSFAPTVNGNYAVVITSGNCSQTSSCTEVIVTGTTDIEGRDAFTVYPNPFNELLTVRTSGAVGNVRVELFNTAGQMVVGGIHSGLEVITVQTADLPSGSYMLRVSSDKASATRVVVR